MRRRSFAGPLLLVIVGGLFLWRNLHPETAVFDLLAQYWPFLLIGWECSVSSKSRSRTSSATPD